MLHECQTDLEFPKIFLSLNICFRKSRTSRISGTKVVSNGVI